MPQLTLQGKYNTATIYTHNIEDTAIGQIIGILNEVITENTTVAIMPDVHAGKGSTIGTTIKLPENKKDWKVCPNVVSVDIGCLDKDTEVLTPNGWIKISQYKNQKILVYEPKTDKALFEKPQAYIKLPCSKFFHYANSKGMNQMVSEEHRMLVYKGNKSRGRKLTTLYPYELNQLKLDNCYYTTKTTFRVNNKGVDLTDTELRLRVMIQADGTRASIHINKETREGREHHSPTYNVIPTKNEYVGYCTPIIVDSEDGYKYCFTTSTGFFVARRNNHIFTTGNCSMRAVKLKEQSINLEKLDNVVNELIPAGQNIYDKAQADTKRLYKLLDGLSFPLEAEKLDRVIRSCGTLGGGNHYIELGTDSNNHHWLSVHTGSRALGVIVATHHQKIAQELLSENKKINQEIIDYLTQNGRTTEIQAALNDYNKNHITPNYIKTKKRPVINPELAYLDGKELDDYLNDVKIAQEYSTISRQLILKRICNAMDFTVVDEFESMHNYIDIDNGIIRKGATSAQNGERLIIPINMRDGSIFATGKGNTDWNFSAPHGAGRILSRSKAKEQLSLEDYKETMSGIYTTSINESTLD